jgi:hypothetical protein
MGMGAYSIHKPLIGNKTVPWRILKAKFKLTNVQFSLNWYNNLMAGTFGSRSLKAFPTSQPSLGQAS